MSEFFIVRPGVLSDLQAVKAIAKVYEDVELGFITRGTIIEAIQKRSLLVAEDSEKHIIGFVHFHITRQGYAVIYDIAVRPIYRGKGIGKALVEHVEKIAYEQGVFRLRLKCPIDLPANKFYIYLGFTRTAIEKGRKRLLNVWEKTILEKRC
jgi:GNAT superfamily N-acetyltransferase